MTQTDRGRFRLMFPERAPQMIAEAYRKEIETAVAKAKRPVRKAKTARKCSQMEVSRFNYRNGRLWNDRETPRLRFGRRELDEDEAQERVMIRGRVPKAFFAWFAEQQKADGPRVLPVVRMDGAAYFVDLRQRQFKETMNPGSYVDFDSVRGKEMCRHAGVVTCLRCGTSVIAPAAGEDVLLRCMKCGGVVEG